MSDERLDAARLILADSSGIVMSSRCLDPQVLKQVTRGPVAHYNKGLAWPADVEAFEIFKDVERRAGEDPVALRAAGVGVVLTDSACADDWVFPATQQVLPARAGVRHGRAGAVAQAVAGRAGLTARTRSTAARPAQNDAATTPERVASMVLTTTNEQMAMSASTTTDDATRAPRADLTRAAARGTQSRRSGAL